MSDLGGAGSSRAVARLHPGYQRSKLVEDEGGFFVARDLREGMRKAAQALRALVSIRELVGEAPDVGGQLKAPALGIALAFYVAEDRGSAPQSGAVFGDRRARR